MPKKSDWMLSFALLAMMLLGYAIGQKAVVILAVAAIAFVVAFSNLRTAICVFFFFSPFSYILQYQQYNIYIFLAMALVFNSLIRRKLGGYLIPCIFVMIYCATFASDTVAIKLGNLIFPILLIMIAFVCKHAEHRDYGRIIDCYTVGFIVATVVGLFKSKMPMMAKLFSPDYYYAEGTGVLDLERFSGLSLDPNFFALLSCVLIACILFGKKKITLKYAIALIFLVVAGFFSFSKSYILMLIAMGLVYMLRASKHIVRNTVIVVALLFAIVVVENVTNIDFVNLIFTRLLAADDANDFTTGRIALWERYLQYIFSDLKCMFFGEGFNSAALIKAAHNSYIDALYRFGFFGSILWGFFFMRSFSYAKTNEKGERNRFVTSVPLWISIVGLMFLSAYHFQQMWACICIPMLAAFMPSEEEEKCQDSAS